MKKKNINIHLISDFTGETTTSIAKGIETQLKGVKFKKFYWFFIKTIPQINEAIFSIKKNPGIVIYTVLSKKILNKLNTELSDNPDVTVISTIEFIVKKCAKFLGERFDETIERPNYLSYEYYKKINSIQYTIDHDDGKNLQTLEKAQIILIGLSRTSKTPTSIYLSYRGYKVANIPFFLHNNFNNVLNKDQLKGKLIIYPYIEPEILSEIRANRKKNILKNQNKPNLMDIKYEDIEYINKEYKELNKFLSKIRHYKINTTNKSIEENCSKIITLYEKHKNNQMLLDPSK